LSCLHPLSAFLVINTTQIIRMLYFRGRFDPLAGDLVFSALIPHFMSILPWGLSILFQQFYFASSRIKSYVLIDTTTTIACIFLSVFFTKKWDLSGLMMAQTVMFFLRSVLLFCFFSKHKETNLVTSIVNTLLRLTIPFAGFIITCTLLNSLFFKMGNSLYMVFITVIINFILSLLVYFVLCKFLKVSIVNHLFSHFKSAFLHKFLSKSS
jgi:putative peptidoglycan lipid II flippase